MKDKFKEWLGREPKFGDKFLTIGGNLAYFIKYDTFSDVKDVMVYYVAKNDTGFVKLNGTTNTLKTSDFDIIGVWPIDTESINFETVTTNKELREKLENFPDDAIISVECCNVNTMVYDKENNLIRID